jgi:bacillithiol system protein YtxJ
LFLSSKALAPKEDWIQLCSTEQVDDLILQSHSKPIAILKHSTRCSISRAVLKQVVGDWEVPAGQIPFYYLDLLQYRNVSSYIATIFHITHQSPQLLLIREGKCVYNESHGDISVSGLLQK